MASVDGTAFQGTLAEGKKTSAQVKEKDLLALMRTKSVEEAMQPLIEQVMNHSCLQHDPESYGRYHTSPPR